MQDTKDLKDQHPAAGPGLEGALGPCVKVGKENRGRQRLVRSDALIQRKCQNPSLNLIRKDF